MNNGRVLSFVFAASLAAPAFAGGNPGFYPVGDLPGGSFNSYVVGLSGDGSTAMVRSWSGTGETGALWTIGSGLASTSPGFVQAASFNASVVVGQRNGAAQLVGGTWTNMIFGQGMASGTSADGSASCGTYFNGTDNRAFRWTSGGGLQTLNLAPGATAAYGVTMSANGNIIAGTTRVGGFDRAYLWTAATGSLLLPNAPWGTLNGVEDISADGNYLVGTANATSAPQAYRWDDNVGAISLGTMGSQSRTWAAGVSGNGSKIVGQYQVASTVYAAFLWDQSGGIRDLKTELVGMGFNLNGWTLTNASSISDDGMVIAGHGINPAGSPEGWVVVIPAPSSGIALLALIAPVAARRRRH